MKFKKFAIIFVAIITLSGCSGKDAITDPSALPSDTPYCRNIMETESGYYYNVASTLSLRYTEKTTGNDIFLCAKPECMHDGNDACTATYNNIAVSDPILYNGYIYFIGELNTEETAGYSLYKLAPDGSSLDKIADVAEERKPPQYNDYGVGHIHIDFIIHKGYVYIPYVIGCYSYLDFIQSGFAKVNIQTGETEILFKCDDYSQAFDFSVYAGCGDYVFYSVNTLSGLGDAVDNYRYNIRTGESEMIMTENDSKLTIACFDDESIYYRYFDNENKVFMLKKYNAENLESSGVEINTGEKVIRDEILCYEDKFFFRGEKDIKVLSKDGELLGTISNEPVEGAVYHNGDTLDISDGKLYTSVKAELLSEEFEVYCCNIDDILNEKGKWEKAYTKKSWSEYWDEDPMMNVLNTEEDV